MVTHIYAILDLRSLLYDQIFTAPADAVAIRYTKATMRDERSPLSMFKEDFALAHIGILDQLTGQVQSEVRHILDLSTIEEAYDNVE